MCKERLKMRTELPGERGWCEVVAPGIYRSLVHHLGDAPSHSDLKLPNPCRLEWGVLFLGNVIDSGTVEPTLVIGLDTRPCDE